MTAYVLLVGIYLLCHYDYFRHCDLTCRSISLLVTESLHFLRQQECTCTSANSLDLPYDCICFVSVTAIVQYDYTIFTATLLLQGHASRNDS